MLEIFMANVIRSPIEYLQLDSFNTDFLEFERMAADNQVLELVFNKNILSPKIELVILDQLEK